MTGTRPNAGNRRKRRLEDALARLDDLAASGGDALAEALEDALAHGSHLVAAKAARIASAQGMAGLAAAMGSAFGRFMVEPAKTDKGCRAKTAIARGLRELEYYHQDVFLSGARYAQPEPAWGGTLDTAGDSRVICAHGLVDGYHPGVLDVLGELLADPEAPVRSGAAAAIAYAGEPGGTALLRHKALAGDAEPSVVGDCLTALMQLDPARSCEFLGRFLDVAGEEEADLALLALGSSRHPDAFEPLRDWYEACLFPARRAQALTAIALLRLDAAVDFLIAELRDGSALSASAVVEALSIYAPDCKLRERAVAAARERGDPVLEEQARTSL